MDEDDFKMDDAEDKAFYEYLCYLPIAKVNLVRKAVNPMLKYMVQFGGIQWERKLILWATA